MWEVPVEDSMQRLIASPLLATKELLRYLLTGRGTFSLSFLQTSLFVQSKLLDDQSEVSPDTEQSALDTSVPDNVPDIEVRSAHVFHVKPNSPLCS